MRPYTVGPWLRRAILGGPQSATERTGGAGRHGPQLPTTRRTEDAVTNEGWQAVSGCTGEWLTSGAESHQVSHADRSPEFRLAWSMWTNGSLQSAWRIRMKLGFQLPILLAPPVMFGCHGPAPTSPQAPALPQAVQVRPSSGTGLMQITSAVFFDTGRATDISVAQVPRGSPASCPCVPLSAVPINDSAFPAANVSIKIDNAR